MKTLLPMAAIVAALALLPLAPARAACHFAIATPIVCTTPRNAAQAFRNFGTDTGRIEKPYVQDTLHAAGCKTYTNAAAHDIKIMQAGKVAFADGYEPVVNISVDDRDLWTVHAKYLAGVCDPYRPTAHFVACEDGPGKAACEQRRNAAIEKARADGQRIEGEGGH